MPGSCRILLLDDEPLILMDLELAAEDADCVALCAADVAEALALVREGKPCCAVLDITLQRGETCLPVARRLEELDIPYLLHSGDFDRRSDTVGALRARLIPKPASSNHVISEALALCERDAR